MQRRSTKKVHVGNIGIGGDAPISIQSMTTTNTKDINATIKQIDQLKSAGCDIVRVAVYDEECAAAIKDLKKLSKLPLVADIHYDYKLAILSIENGIDKLRINPGNIGSIKGVKSLVSAAKEKKIPIRIGVNSGSIKKEYADKYGNTHVAMAESALEHINLVEKFEYNEIVVSLKASNVLKTIEAYKYLSARVDYPMHLGITEAGTMTNGIIKSSIGIGGLLLNGIGDTIRVSLTASPVEEVKVGIGILNSLGLKQRGIEIISCPTCGRCNYDLINIVKKLEEATSNIKSSIKVAVMGCVVNGPGEAREADIGIAGGNGKIVLFKKGKIIKTASQEQALEILISEIQEMV